MPPTGVSLGRHVSGIDRLLASNTTANAALLSEGWRSALPTAANTRYVPMGRRGVRLGFYGTGADDATGNFRVYTVSLRKRRGEDDCLLRLYGGSSTNGVTLSTHAGPGADTLITSSERVADALGWTLATESTTPDGAGEDIESAYVLGEAMAYEPGSNVPAELYIPHLPFSGLVIELWVGTATSLNGYYETVD